ncbi:hypothetical protein FF38_05132 [Lucilia cuprina]|uniref:Uncharacterized protein n=1 Tax=Lucilia cuprina TaxID=7375 RepID=A0A0L0BWY1_LUCCU|nr:hypothetical protein FF38_05132 [Lucilia cuprina]
MSNGQEYHVYCIPLCDTYLLDIISLKLQRPKDILKHYTAFEFDPSDLSEYEIINIKDLVGPPTTMKMLLLKLKRSIRSEIYLKKIHTISSPTSPGIKSSESTNNSSDVDESINALDILKSNKIGKRRGKLYAKYCNLKKTTKQIFDQEVELPTTSKSISNFEFISEEGGQIIAQSLFHDNLSADEHESAWKYPKACESVWPFIEIISN